MTKKNRRSDVVCKTCSKKENLPNSRAKNYKYCSTECMKKDYFKYKCKKGDMIHNWKITSDGAYRMHCRCYVDVECTCGSGIKKKIPAYHIEKKRTYGCIHCSLPYNSKGHERISGEFWKRIESGAKKRNLEFNITSKFCWELLIKQDMKCALTGLDIFLGKHRHERSKTTASLDRIDSEKGYTENNIQWVHKDINLMKNAFNQEYFIEMCKKIVEVNNESKDKKIE